MVQEILFLLKKKLIQKLIKHIILLKMKIQFEAVFLVKVQT